MNTVSLQVRAIYTPKSQEQIQADKQDANARRSNFFDVNFENLPKNVPEYAQETLRDSASGLNESVSTMLQGKKIVIFGDSNSFYSVFNHEGPVNLGVVVRKIGDMYFEEYLRRIGGWHQSYVDSAEKIQSLKNKFSVLIDTIAQETARPSRESQWERLQQEQWKDISTVVELSLDSCRNQSIYNGRADRDKMEGELQALLKSTGLAYQIEE